MDHHYPPTLACWPITSFRAAHQPRRFRHEADIGFRESRDLNLGVRLRQIRDHKQRRNARGGPAKTDGLDMPPDDSAESTGGRLEARYPGSRTGHKRLLSHRWGS
jgi:hypothetical protein